MLSAEGLRHAFRGGRVVALDDVPFSRAAALTLTVCGPRGAGQTSLLRVLAGLIRPDAGRVTVAGGRGAIGWIGHHSHLYGHLTVRENLLFWASLYGVPPSARGVNAAATMRRVGVADWANQPVWSLSRGLVRRAAIARWRIHDQRRLLRVEQFTGLDLKATAALRALLEGLRGAGHRVVVAR